MSKKAVEIPQFVDCGAEAVERLTGSKVLKDTYAGIVSKMKTARAIEQDDYLFCRRFVFMQILYR